MNPRLKRPTASDLVPSTQETKKMTYEQMEALYEHRKQRTQQQTIKPRAEPSPEARPIAL
jgi:hypothetical protein